MITQSAERRSEGGQTKWTRINLEIASCGVTRNRGGNATNAKNGAQCVATDAGREHNERIGFATIVVYTAPPRPAARAQRGESYVRGASRASRPERTKKEARAHGHGQWVRRGSPFTASLTGATDLPEQK